MNRDTLERCGHGRSCASFLQTQWSLVRRAVDEQAPGSRAALESLCQSCWYPIYAFIRRCGKSAADAEDLCQGFFERVLSTRLFAAASASPAQNDPCRRPN